VHAPPAQSVGAATSSQGVLASATAQRPWRQRSEQQSASATHAAPRAAHAHAPWTQLPAQQSAAVLQSSRGPEQRQVPDW
jgi:hypothetical protein